ncbi:MAG: GNAT family N-acetyltransferase [Methanococcaceae archaeon]
MAGSNFEILLLEPESYQEWNQFVDESPQGDVFCYSWWLDAVTKSRFKIYVLIENGRIVAGMPLALNKAGKIDEPALTRTLGILYSAQLCLDNYSQTSNQRKWASALLDRIKINDFVQTCTHHTFTDWLPYRWKGLNQTTRYTYILEYRKRTIDILRNNLESGCRNVINRAERNILRVEESTDLKEFYGLVSQSYSRQGLKFKMQFSDLKTLDDSIKSNGKRVILSAMDERNNVHAAIYIVYNQRSAYYLLSGGNPGYRKLGGHTLVFWEAIKYFSDKVQYSNFGGSDIQRIESHLRCFGGELTQYFHIYNDHAVDKGLKYHLSELSYHTKAFLKKSTERLLFPSI